MPHSEETCGQVFGLEELAEVEIGLAQPWIPLLKVHSRWERQTNPAETTAVCRWFCSFQIRLILIGETQKMLGSSKVSLDELVFQRSKCRHLLGEYQLCHQIDFGDLAPPSRSGTLKFACFQKSSTEFTNDSMDILG